MAPKPFPFAISLGTDICQISRIQKIAAHKEYFNLWARKVFTRLEWPRLYRRLTLSKEIAEPCNIQMLHLPPINISDESSTKSLLQSHMLQHLAGRSVSLFSTVASILHLFLTEMEFRWAAKEAVIKAHNHRRVFMSEISIITERQASSKGAYALVDPPSQTVVMNEDVARVRGLRGYGNNDSKHVHRVGPFVYGSIANGGFRKTEPALGRKFITRRAKVKAEDRQIAEVSISHDGDYAVATCLAVNEPAKQTYDQPLIDDGSGDPIHEPAWADNGWLVGTDAMGHEIESPEFSLGSSDV